ncbi:hypothetical protein FJQ87_12895 [Shewanella sp. SNU WT4]|uniref:hypothetical protein n=1 Tax=Shewanella sp. SNU WT4 TaxID=2590015 RepID=UPI00112C0CDD|nr:hypothetical protein [Shewanella sp. SNU WT4]QDF67470.1 hypothetical protein FJQ87_12895 [Shewanella sp. SNU WT4]
MRIILLIIILLINGCGPDPIDGSNTPESAVLGFFQAIYIDNNVDGAKEFVTPELAELLQHYYLASQIQRHVFSLPMTQVKLKILEVELDFLRKSSDVTTVIIKFDGLKGGKVWVDDRKVKIRKIRGRWIITDFIAETNVRG